MAAFGRWGWAGRGLALATWLAASALALAASAQNVDLPVPSGILPPEVPADNPPTAAKIALGKKLYFEKRLSTDGTVACATCHDPRHGFSDPRDKPTSAGVGGALGTRNSPTTLNAAFLASQFWDGRAATLEDQALQPLTNPIEHGFPDQKAVLAKLATLEEYPALFAAAFGSKEQTPARIGQAIASFERTLLTLDAPIDRFLAGDKQAISESAQRGWELFNAKARCNTCHGRIDVLPLFTDDQFHNIGVGVAKTDFATVSRKVAAMAQSGESIDELALTNEAASELGRFLVTRESKDLGAFKTPQLRNVALTAPYMHDGSEATLEGRDGVLRPRGQRQPVPRRRDASAESDGRREGGSRRAARDLHEQRSRALRGAREARREAALRRAMYRNDMTRKEIERAFAERSDADTRLIQSLHNCDRRHFLRTSLKFAGMAAAASLVPSHTFQLVNVANAATAPGAAGDIAFRFAYVSDTHLFARGMTHRFARAAAKAVEDMNALDPQPDFILFGGDLAQLGRADELALGQQILKDLKAPVRMMVGEHDWYLDMGEKWKEMFGPDRLLLRAQGHPLRRAEQRGRGGLLDGEGLHAGAAHGDRRRARRQPAELLHGRRPSSAPG